jgi:hypothetical protein
VKEGFWEVWRGTDSLLERFVDGKKVRIEGPGTLELEEDEESTWESGAPRGPGQVYFVLFCDFEGIQTSHSEAINVKITSRDDAAFSIIRGVKSEGLSPFPRYRLSGSVSTTKGEVPIQMGAVTLDSRSFSPISIPEMKISRTVSVGTVTLGSLEITKDLIDCKLVVPNFAEEAVVEGGGLRISLKEISPEATSNLYAVESQDKLLPGSYLEVQRLQDNADETVGLAVEDFGWLLSFYSGSRIHPVIWEGETDSGTVWNIQTTRLITPLDTEHVESCVSKSVPLERFLQYGWRAWRNLDEERRTRLRGAVNFYTDVLSATFPTQKLALTTMYLERFRDLMFGSSTLLEAINEDQKKVDTKKLSKKVRGALRDSIDQNEGLSTGEKEQLIEAVNKVGGGQVNGLFRKTLKESLLELYERADLVVDPVELGRFIRERDTVIHGSWDSGRGGTLKTYRLAEYGLNLLEMLLLRLFEYEGKYYNRTSISIEELPAGKFSW